MCTLKSYQDMTVVELIIKSALYRTLSLLAPGLQFRESKII